MLAIDEEDNWKVAIDAELTSINKHNIWEIFPKLSGANLLGTTWVFRKKTDSAGNLLKYKARLCVQGFGKVEGIDYNETFAPTGQPGSLQLLLAVCAYKGCDIHQMDVKTAFLHGSVEEYVYIKIPYGYSSEVLPNSCLKLRKSLYGLKQSPQFWYQCLLYFFSSIRFKPSPADPCFFLSEDSCTCVFIRVDDLIIGGVDVMKVKESLNNCFKMDDLGEAEFILGMKVTR